MSAMNGATAPHFLIAVNPDAGGERKRVVALVAARLTECGRDVVIEEATEPGRIYQLAKTAPADAFLVAGGDGSVNEAVRGLLDRPAPRPVLGVLPQGTVNVLATELGLPRDARALAELFLRGETKPLHVGLINGRPFTLMASAGFDAEVVKSVDRALKKKIGRFAYAVAAVKTLLRGGFADVMAQTDVGPIRGKCVVIAKSKFYGGLNLIARDADVKKSGLQLVALRDISLASIIALIRYFSTGRTDAAGHIRKVAIRRATISGEGVAAQIDGDYFGDAPCEIRECGETLRILA